MTSHQIDSTLLVLALRKKEIALNRAKYQYKISWYHKVLSWVGI